MQTFMSNMVVVSFEDRAPRYKSWHAYHSPIGVHHCLHVPNLFHLPLLVHSLHCFKMCHAYSQANLQVHPQSQTHFGLCKC
jgi:hypothetical protein